MIMAPIITVAVLLVVASTTSCVTGAPATDAIPMMHSVMLHWIHDCGAFVCCVAMPMTIHMITMPSPMSYVAAPVSDDVCVLAPSTCAANTPSNAIPVPGTVPACTASMRPVVRRC